MSIDVLEKNVAHTFCTAMLLFLKSNIYICYMAESASWQAVLIGYPSKEDEPILPALNFQHWSCNKKVFFWPYNLILYWHSLFGQEEWILAFMLIILCRWPCKFIIYYHITVIFARLLQNILIFVISIAVF